MEDEARRRDRDCFMAKTSENPPLSDGRVRGRDYSSVTLRWAIATKQICQALCLSEVSDGELTLKTRGSSPTPVTLNWIRVRKYMDRWSIQPSIGETTCTRIESKHQDKNEECFSFTVVHAHYILILFPKKSTLNLVKRKHPNYPWAITTSVINSDFFTRSFPYVTVVIAINQQRRALSAKARCSFPSICLRR